MAKRGGFPGMGMPGNMNNLMKQAQKMQRQMEENQKALEVRSQTCTFFIWPLVFRHFSHGIRLIHIFFRFARRSQK